jgi:hypothetical protein
MAVFAQAAVTAIADVPKAKRGAAVNALLAGKAVNELELAWRAQFLTALREADVWPVTHR